MTLQSNLDNKISWNRLARCALGSCAVFSYIRKYFVKPVICICISFRFLNQVSERVGHLHHSLGTDKTYLYWVRFYVQWRGRNGKTIHPREMEPKQVETSLTMLATARKVLAPMQNQALSEILFLAREMLKMTSGGTAHTTNCANHLNI